MIYFLYTILYIIEWLTLYIISIKDYFNNMNNYLSRYFFIFVLFTIPFSIFANQLTSNPVDLSLKKTEITNTINYPATFLWKIEKTGKPVSYLLGTVHLGKDGSHLPDRVINILSQTNSLMTEVDLMPNDNEMLALASSFIETDEHITLSSKLGKDNFEKLAKSVNDKIPKIVLDRMKPWVALSLIMYSIPDGYSDKYGIDELLANKAIEINKKYLALEMHKDALDLFSSIPEDKVKSMITVMLSLQKELQAESLKILNFYQNNQVNELVALVNNHEELLHFTPKEDVAFWQKWLNNDVLLNRNKKWLPLIKQQINKESTLVAVGAAHIFGKYGLIESLQSDGYQITPVMP